MLPVGEMMRGLRHSLEAIFDPDWEDLARVCIACMSSERAGTRMWAAEQLGVLREPIAYPALIAGLDDAHTVLGSVTRAITMLCRAHPRLAGDAIAALRMRAAKEQAGSLFAKAAEEIAATETR